MKTILILDDEQFVRKSIADFFDDQMWRTVQAKSGEDALELIDKEKPHAAIVDVRLPGIDGNAFIRSVFARNLNIAMVICTGSPEYLVQPEFVGVPCVSQRLFRKPVSDLPALENEVLSVLAQLDLEDGHN